MFKLFQYSMQVQQKFHSGRFQNIREKNLLRTQQRVLIICIKGMGRKIINRDKFSNR